MSASILLIQDSPSDARLICEALSNHGTTPFQVVWVRQLAAALEWLANDEIPRQPRSNGVAALLVDLFLPDSRGIETFERLFHAAPQVPILILGATHAEEVARLAVQQGAQDYLLTSRLDADLLPKTVRSMIERAALRQALSEEKERAQVTLDSIEDAVICTDVAGNVTYLNTAGEHITGWSREEAAGRPVEEVCRIIDADTREAAQSPMAVAIREDKAAGLTPNCVLIRRDGMEVAIEESAAPVHDRRGRVTGAVMVFRDVSAARALSTKMFYLAQHDSLTDLPNRTLLNDRLARAIALSGRHRQRLAVLFLDVDRFKHINDSLGHVIGDRLLQSIAQRLLASVRNSDTVSRLGGDEFVIVLSEVAHAKHAAVSAEKILLALSTPHRIDQHDVHVTVSIGIATYPDDGTTVETLLQHADVAMYHAKESGRNDCRFFEPQMNVRARERQALKDDLRRALERQEFLLHFQPKMNLRTGTTTGVEALLRWRHPQRGVVPPATFIAVAAECGFIVPIGQWVLREACSQARAWQATGLRPTRVAVNLSAVELRARDFVAGVRDILRETGLDPAHLELEFTETVLMQDATAAATVLEALKDLGVYLTLDDFGTGYSSLSHLQRFPIDAVKIDQSFVRGLTTNANHASLVSALISMGKTLRLRVVAEGVETRQQLAFLQEHGCPEGQGYYFSRPAAAGDLTEFFAPRTEAPRSSSG